MRLLIAANMGAYSKCSFYMYVDTKLIHDMHSFMTCLDTEGKQLYAIDMSTV
jgi:hypothetical protein